MAASGFSPLICCLVVSLMACGDNRPAVCGDGVQEGDEECDDGNADDADACRSTCERAQCGDGVVRLNIEECDDGVANSDTTPDACRSNCQKAGCGDGVLDLGEACDDGNERNDDSCLATCVSATCGDGSVQLNVEECDDGSLNSDTLANACRTNCKRPFCGDLVIDAGEECEDGNTSTNDACALCLAATCGDGFVHAFVEQCDDGNVQPDDDCAECAIATCGDGHIRDGVEECDNGTANSDLLPDHCRSSCKLPACGDGVIDGGETCDSSGVSTIACDSDCTAPSCGDGLTNVAAAETCDDGNNVAGDGCTSCVIDAGWVVYVNAAATGANNGSSWFDAYRSLQDALANITRGEIWMARGDYFPDTGNGITPDDPLATFQLKSNVAIFGGFVGTEIARVQRDVASAASNNPTSLNGLIKPGTFSQVRSQHILTVNGVTGVRLDTVKIEEAGGSPGAGLRASNSTLLIANSVVSRNISEAQLTSENQKGGAIQAIASSLTIERTSFNNNIVIGSSIQPEVKALGGAIYAEDGELAIYDSNFFQNGAHGLVPEGGAIFASDTDLLISRTRFFGNTTAGGSFHDARGGAIYIVNPASVTPPVAFIYGSTFDTNIASAAFLKCEGAAIFASAGSSVVLANNLFIHNDAIDYTCRGGAIYAAAMSSVTVRNCTFADNSVGGSNNGNALGGAVYADDGSALSVASSVFWMNHASAAGDDVYSTPQASTSVTYSCMQTAGWGAGTQQLTSSPFDSLASSNFRLASTSSCIDAGDNTAAALDRFDEDRDGDTSEPVPLDLANKSRFADYPLPDTGAGNAPLVDCGAYEKPRP